MGGRGLYGDIERSYNNNIKTSTLKAARYMYMCIFLHLVKNVQMY